MQPNQGHTIKYLVILIIAVVTILAFASFAQGDESSEGQNDGQATNAQQDQKQQEPKSALNASQSQVDAFKDLQKIALQRESVISNNVLAHQAKMAWEAEQIYVALREVLSYTMPSMVGDLDQWRAANIPAINLGNPGELQGLDGRQIDLATAKDQNWKDILGNQNALYLKQKEVADRQFSSHNYEIMWMECSRQFLTRLAEVLRPQPAAATSYYGGDYSGGSGEAAAIQDPTKPADVNTPYEQDWGYNSVPEVIDQNGGAEQTVDEAFEGMNIQP